jgi:hypothetical protein
VQALIVRRFRNSTGYPPLVTVTVGRGDSTFPKLLNALSAPDEAQSQCAAGAMVLTVVVVSRTDNLGPVTVAYPQDECGNPQRAAARAVIAAVGAG